MKAGGGVAATKRVGQRMDELHGELERAWLSCGALAAGFAECTGATRELYAMSGGLLAAPADAPPEFRCGLAPVPEALFSFRRNLFSTLFQASYHLLGIPPARRRFHARINHLFRLWVTSADNLLDGEDKRVFPIELPGESRVMRQVVGILAGDRILFRLLARAVEEGILSSDEALWYADETLRVMLPSAAQEASEEGGVRERPDPEYVLHTLHLMKTGLLFQLPFAGFARLAPLPDAARLDACRRALTAFGLGCQLLDDVRDLARDFLQRRHNYLLSEVAFHHRDALRERLERLAPELTPDSRIHDRFPELARPAAARAHRLLLDGLLGLAGAGLELDAAAAERMAGSMFAVLDVEDLAP